MFEADSLRRALSTLGVLLGDRGLTYEVVAIGGGGLLFARPLPQPLLEAIDDTARTLGLASDWLNAGPTDQLKQGLPEGFRERTVAQVFGGLTLHLASRFDQICFKLYAAADHAPGSKHIRDLIDLEPTRDEFDRASSWVKQQDAADEFPRFVDAVIALVEARHAGP